MSDPVSKPAYLRWRSDNRIAGTLIIAALSLIADALVVIFGLHVARGSLMYTTVLLVAAVLNGLLMTHNRLALTPSKLTVLLLAVAVLALRSTNGISGTTSLVFAMLAAVLALACVLLARGQHWEAFMHDVRTGEDTPRAAIRDLRSDG